MKKQQKKKSSEKGKVKKLRLTKGVLKDLDSGASVKGGALRRSKVDPCT